MAKDSFTPTPRDQRVKVLDKMDKASLVFRAKSLGWIFGAENADKDELVSNILRIEQEKGLVTQ
jgi:hypothetical protein